MSIPLYFINMNGIFFSSDFDDIRQEDSNLLGGQITQSQDFDLTQLLQPPNAKGKNKTKQKNPTNLQSQKPRWEMSGEFFCILFDFFFFI